MSTKLKIKSIHKATQKLSETELNELWELYAPHHNVSREEYLGRVLNGLTHLTQYRDAYTYELVGCTGVREEIFTLSSGAKAYTVYSGMSFILPAYRGLHLLPRTLSYYSLKLKLSNPFRQVFVWSDAISYKPYLLTARSTRKFFPSRKFATPPQIQELIHLVGHQFYGENYDEASGTVRKESNRLKQHVAPVSDRDLRDPDIAFFVRHNPGYAKGDGLINVIPITFRNISTSFVNGLIKAGRRKRKAARSGEKLTYAHN